MHFNWIQSLTSGALTSIKSIRISNFISTFSTVTSDVKSISFHFIEILLFSTICCLFHRHNSTSQHFFFSPPSFFRFCFVGFLMEETAHNHWWFRVYVCSLPELWFSFFSSLTSNLKSDGDLRSIVVTFFFRKGFKVITLLVSPLVLFIR
jgi:hypothetical protein